MGTIQNIITVNERMNNQEPANPPNIVEICDDIIKGL